MKPVLFLILLLLTLPTIGKATEPSATIEEIVIMAHFVHYQAGLTYDETCNKANPKDRYNLKNPKNINLLGNEQMLAARAGGLQHIRYPNKSADELVGKLVAVSKNVKNKLKTTLKEKGCSSKEAIGAQKALKLFSNVHPAQIYSFIDKEIVQKGGKITSHEEIEAVGKQQK